jgi:tripeptide aminopeptidase
MKRFVILCILALSSTSSGQPPDAAVTRIIDSAEFKRATAFIEGDYERFVRELIVLTEIPAPTFKEAARAKAYLAMLKESGLSDVEMDAEGNVMGVRKGTAAGGSMLAIVAHLDTVFPEGTDVKVKRDGTRLLAPGVADNTRGAVLLLAVIRAMNAAKFRTSSDILFVGNVAEEGEGDLRGTKFLLRKGKYKDRVKQFIAVDNDNQATITRAGVGSLRYRVSFTGPGGHSYSGFGLVNPAFAMGAAIAKFSRLKVPAKPKTTFSVGIVSGGTSINSIPVRVHMDVDLRSESCAELKKVNEAFLALLHEAVDEENAARSTREGKIELDPKLIGDRPCGETALGSPIVQTSAAVLKAFALTPTYDFSSTDANVPMNLGIPAITIGRGASGRTHSPDEWTDVAKPDVVRAVRVATAIIVAVAQLAGT